MNGLKWTDEEFYSNWDWLQDLRSKLTFVGSEIEAGLGIVDKNLDELEVAYVCQELRSKLGMFDRIWDRSSVFDRKWDWMFCIPTGNWST